MAHHFSKLEITDSDKGPLVKWLRHRPFTAVTGVRIPYGSPSGGLAQLGEHLPYKQGVGSSILSSSTIQLTSRGGAVWQLVGLITRRSKVQILPPQPIHIYGMVIRH